MNTHYSARHALPFLATAQAQKEITHNEALILIDSLLHPSIQEVETAPPLLDIENAGKCWLIGEGATGYWVGHEHEMACWTGGSWRFLELPLGSRVFNNSTESYCQKAASGWLSAPEIAAPSGGAVIDWEAREAIEILLEHLRSIGVVASGA